MIQLIPKGDKIYQMKVELHLPQCKIIEFLQMNGYTVLPYLWKYTDETFPNGPTNHETWTFTATKLGEVPSDKNMFGEVFEREIKEIIKKG